MKSLISLLLILMYYSPGAQVVGIGAPAIQSTVQITQPGFTSIPHFILYDSTTGNGEYMRFLQKNSVTSWRILTALDHSILQIKNSTDPDAILSMESAGNIGINTSDPSNIFHVNSYIKQTAIFNGSAASYIMFGEQNNNYGYFGSFAGNTNDVDFGTLLSNTSGGINLLTRGQIRLAVKETGDIGIGTLSNPQQSLSIGGGVLIDYAQQHEEKSYTFLGGTIPGNTKNSLQFGLTGGVKIGSDRREFYNSPSHWINFYLNDTVECMKLKDNGLEIGEGAGNVLGIRVAGDVWTDTLVLSRGYLHKYLNNTAIVGSHNNDLKELTIFFGHTFSKPPIVHLTIQQENNANFTDTFVANLKQVLADRMIVKVVRIDSGANGNGWGQNVKLDWWVTDEY